MSVGFACTVLHNLGPHFRFAEGVGAGIDGILKNLMNTLIDSSLPRDAHIAAMPEGPYVLALTRPSAFQCNLSGDLELRSGQ
jgi:hypothetical protein